MSFNKYFEKEYERFILGRFNGIQNLNFEIMFVYENGNVQIKMPHGEGDPKVSFILTREVAFKLMLLIFLVVAQCAEIAPDINNLFDGEMLAIPNGLVRQDSQFAGANQIVAIPAYADVLDISDGNSSQSDTDTDEPWTDMDTESSDATEEMTSFDLALYKLYHK